MSVRYGAGRRTAVHAPETHWATFGSFGQSSEGQRGGPPVLPLHAARIAVIDMRVAAICWQ